MKKRGFCIMLLCTCMVLSSLTGCGNPAEAPLTQTTAVNPANTFTNPTYFTEPDEPEDGSFRLYYDDRCPVSALGATEDSEIVIKDQQVTSKIVGTSELDAQVLIHDKQNDQLIAVGTGTAIVSIDGIEQLVRVRPARISLFMITGHSIGAGQCGNGAQSVASEPGQAYSCHKASTFQEATEDMGIGYLAAVKPNGIDAFIAGNGGTIGEGSALAWQWHQLTGEKAWVLNAAVGGSCINEWINGEDFYEKAVSMYRAAAQVLRNEIAAGHYILRNTAIIYHSAANFGYKNVEFTDEIMEFWYHSMCEGFKTDLAMDIDGDGNNETINAIGFVPIWGKTTQPSYTYDKPANYFMAASDVYPNIFMCSQTVLKWFKGLPGSLPEIKYQTQSEPVENPTEIAACYAEDNVHCTQVVYNANGLDIADSLYAYLRTNVKAESITLTTVDGRSVTKEINLNKKGATVALVLATEPYYANNFTISVSENLEINYPFVLKATAEGTGYLTISKNGEVLLEITVNVG